MAQPAPEPPEDAQELLHRNVRKTVAIATLRKIRRIVDDYDEQDRANQRLSRRMLSAAAMITAGLAVIIVLSGAALPRLLTAVLGWFR